MLVKPSQIWSNLVKLGQTCCKLVLFGTGHYNSRKSTSGFLFTFAGGAVSWQSKLQKCVALSTTEAEYIYSSKRDVMDEEICPRAGFDAR